jgi:hypothetical protein
MGVFEFLAFAVLMVCIFGVAIVERVIGGGRRAKLREAEQRVQDLLLRIGELERHNDELRQQLDWNRRLLEAQDRVVKELGGTPVPHELPTTR